MISGEIGLRFTPACAGRTFGSCTMAGVLPVHPRVCGEDKAFGINLDQYHGSPPRVRGGLLRDCGHSGW